MTGIDVQAVFNNVTDGILLFDMDRNIVLMNEPAARLMGRSPGPLSLRDTIDAVEMLSADGAALPYTEWATSRAHRGEFLHREEMQVRRRDTGQVANVEVSAAPVFDSSGQIQYVQLLLRDITDRKAFDLIRTRLSAIVESSEDAIVGKDENGIVTSWNHGAEKIFGYTAEEMVGHSIKRLLPLDRQAEEDDILARIRRGENVDHRETTRVRKDGSEIWISLTISPIHDAKGRIVGASKVARDITVQRRLERQMHQSQKMEAIGQLTGGIAHDFNNLLGIVIGNLDLLEPLVAGDAVVSKRVAAARKAALRGAALTKRLLAFSSREELNPTVTSLEHSIRNTLELAQHGLGPEIRIAVDMDPAIPRLVVDIAGLESLVLNLVVNARDAMPSGGVLTVGARLVRIEADYPPVKAEELKVGHYACVTVSDTGCGMSGETLERAFEPFYSTKPRGRGTGLGLSMAYGFVKQSGGTMRLYSEPGVGTTVSFYLPIPEGQVADPEIAAADAGNAGLQGCTVLIVDDEEDLLEIAASYVEELGCVALRAIDGPAALEILARDGSVDVLITDVIMPGGMSGAALAQRARALYPTIQIIYCSGFPADALAERPFLLADGPLLRKPYQRAELHALLRRAAVVNEPDPRPDRGTEAGA